MKALVIFLLAAFSAPALAARPDTVKMTCRDAASLVEQNGAIVLSTGPGLFDRYVADSRYCGTGERAVNAYVPAADKATCLIGNVCRDKDFGAGAVIVKPIQKCKEGSTQIFYENTGNDRQEAVPYVCANSKWVRKYAK